MKVQHHGDPLGQSLPSEGIHKWRELVRERPRIPTPRRVFALDRQL